MGAAIFGVLHTKSATAKIRSGREHMRVATTEHHGRWVYEGRGGKKGNPKTTKSFSENAGPGVALHRGWGRESLRKLGPAEIPPEGCVLGLPLGSPGFLPAPAPLGAGAKRKGLESHLLLPRSEARVPCPPFGAGHAKVEGGQLG